MIRDFKPAWTEYVPRYVVRFYDHPDGGYAFDCDRDGKVDESKMTDVAKRNYHFALENPDKFPYAWNEVADFGGNVRHPASGKCVCGKRIDLTASYLGACDCPRCGRWWNIFGDALKNPREWRKGGDW